MNLYKTLSLGYQVHFKMASFRQLRHTFTSSVSRVFNRRIYPISVLLALNYDCPCKCAHCGVSDFRNAERNCRIITFAEIKEIIFSLVKIGIMHITLTGGEPILREDIFDIIKFVSHQGVIISLDTCGYNLDYSKVVKLKASGLNLIKVSLDNPEADMHDEIRGVVGCFDRAIGTIRSCVETGMPCVIAVTVTKELLMNGNLEDIVRLGKKLMVSGVKLELLAFSGEALDKKYIGFTSADIEYLKKICKDKIVYFRNIFSDFSECLILRKKIFYISAYGDVYPCMFTPIKFGNLLTEKFSHIWEKMKTHAIYNYSPIDCYGIDGRLRKEIFETYGK